MPYKNPEVAKQKARERYEAKKEEILAKTREYYQTHKEQCDKKRKEWQRNNAEKTRAYGAKWRAEHPEENRQRILGYKERRKEQVFDHYGRKCVCCGEARKEFLSMDHVNGGGNQHRREAKLTNSTDLYLWIIRHNFPPDFRVLCHNCNASRGYYGYCPHEKERVGEVDS